MPLDILNKFSTNLKDTLVRAINLSIQLKHPQVKPLHLLISLGEQPGSIANEIIQKYKLNQQILRTSLQRSRWPNNERLYTLPQLSSETVRILEHAAVIAFDHHHKYIGTEHLLLSIIELADDQLQQLFKNHAIDVKAIRQQTLTILKSTSRFPDVSSMFQEDTEEDDVTTEEDMEETEESAKGDDTSQTQALDFFSIDLTDDKIQQTIDPVIGRDKEIERLIHILSRRTKNNPVLLGEPGVGKTAIVEGLAKRILEGKVPSVLRDKKIYRLDLGMVVAGTMYRGEFEARFKQIIEELKSHPNSILFIDEIHTLVGAGGTGGNAMDAANILKPSLARGEIRCIGATTLQEYQKHIESDAALERRLQPIIVEEPTMEETMQVLKGVKHNYEQFHGVRISDEAIEAATKLSVRYIQDRFLPDKALDLIDEAAARFKIEQPANPLEQSWLDLENKLRILQSQKLALVKEEKFEAAIELKKKERSIRKQLSSLKQQLEKMEAVILGTISAEDVATIVARMTNIPLEQLVESEKKRLLDLEAQLNTYVIGQNEATKSVAEFIKRSRAGLNEPNRPIGSFLFLGPSGVGKTQLAKTLARLIFGSAENMIRIDMSEFSEGFTTSKLIGAPAGYVGYKEGSKLTDQVRHKPYSLVLFDEIEKAHPDIFNLLLQILDEGHLTDASGKKVNFKNTVIIMTSNVGLRQFQEQAQIGFTHDHTTKVNYEHIKSEVMKELQRMFRPEFLNRIDKTIVFQPLQEDTIVKIVELQLQELYNRAQEKNITLTATKPLLKHLAKIGYTPMEGARAIRRIVQEHIENPLAEKLLSDQITAGDKITMGYQQNNIVFTKRQGRKSVNIGIKITQH